MNRLIFVTLFMLSSCATSKAKQEPRSEYASVNRDGQAAIATVHPMATRAGINAINAGGNAIDAALAAAFTLGVVDSHNSGIGGGCFILARLASGDVIAIDGREMAPAKAHKDMFLVDGNYNKQLSKTGAMASGIPGSVQALYDLQKLAGKLKFSDVILPAAKIAEEGFAIDRTLSLRLNRVAKRIGAFPETAKIFFSEGTPLKQGQRLVQRDLAASYRKLAAQGPEWFYRGEFARLTETWMKKNGGIITAKDFANYKTLRRVPVKSRYMGHDIYGFPPPSSGGAHVAQVLNILSHFDLAKMSDVQRYHVVAEAMKLAFADRAHWMGDADFVPVPKGIIAKGYATALANKIDLNRANSAVEHGVPPKHAEELFNKHTTHIAAADKAGNWVAITTTLNTSFGSKVVIPGTGVLMNNQMDDFVAQPDKPNAFGLLGGDANSIAAGKRPLSSMSPSLVMKNGQPVMTLGAAGGPTIISQVIQTIVYKLALGRPLHEAVDGLRVHHQWQPPLMFVESRIPEADRLELQKRGHRLKQAGDFGGTQAIALENGKLHAVTEPRVIRRNSAAQR